MQNKFKMNRDSMIVATVIVSKSELLAYNPRFFDGITPEKFKQVLFELGIDTNRGIVEQKNLIHRNRLNQVVQCTRWLGEERQDEDWIKSGYASREALDKHSCNRILDDLYRSKGLTEDTQAIMEDRDKHATVDESYWEA